MGFQDKPCPRCGLRACANPPSDLQSGPLLRKLVQCIMSVPGLCNRCDCPDFKVVSVELSPQFLPGQSLTSVKSNREPSQLRSPLRSKYASRKPLSQKLRIALSKGICWCRTSEPHATMNQQTPKHHQTSIFPLGLCRFLENQQKEASDHIFAKELSQMRATYEAHTAGNVLRGGGF